MKILFLSNSLVSIYGGGEKSLEQMIKHLNTHKCTFIGKNTVFINIFRKYNQRAISSNGGFEPATKTNILLIPITICLQLLQIIRHNKVFQATDIVIHKTPSVTEFLFLIPVLILFYKKPILYIAEIYSYPNIKKFKVIKPLVKFCLQRANTEMVFVSKSSMQAWHKSICVPYRSTVIYNGMDRVEEIDFQKIQFSNHSTNISFIARLEEDKGILDLLAAIKILNDKNTSHKIIFNLYGQCKADLKKQITTEVSHINHQNSNIQVQLHGFISNVSEIYQNSDVVIFPSHTESFGRVLVESWQFGVPVICSNLEVFQEIHFLGKISQELIFQSRDPESMVHKIEFFIESKPKLLDPKYRNKLAQFANNEFDLEKTIARYQEIIERLAKKNTIF